MTSSIMDTALCLSEDTPLWQWDSLHPHENLFPRWQEPLSPESVIPPIPGVTVDPGIVGDRSGLCERRDLNQAEQGNGKGWLGTG